MEQLQNKGTIGNISSKISSAMLLLLTLALTNPGQHKGIQGIQEATRVSVQNPKEQKRPSIPKIGGCYRSGRTIFCIVENDQTPAEPNTI